MTPLSDRPPAAEAGQGDRSEEIRALVAEHRELTRRLDRLSGEAVSLVREFAATREDWLAKLAFLDLAPGVSDRLETLTAQLFGEVLDEIEGDLTQAVREILGQDRTVVTRREIKGSRLSIAFEMEQDGQVEDILVGQGGSVCNILSVGLRLVALSQLDPARHRPFLVLDEQDCWLRPELVPRFVRLIGLIADRLGIQVLYISHHPVDLFALEANRVFALRPSREFGARVTILTDRPVSGGELPALAAAGTTMPGGD